MNLTLAVVTHMIGAVFTAEGTSITVKMTHEEWVEEGRPTSVYLDLHV